MEISTFIQADKINDKINKCEQALENLYSIRHLIDEKKQSISSVNVTLLNSDITEIDVYAIGERFTDDILDYLIRRLEMELSQLQTEFKKL